MVVPNRSARAPVGGFRHFRSLHRSNCKMYKTPAEISLSFGARRLMWGVARKIGNTTEGLLLWMMII